MSKFMTILAATGLALAGFAAPAAAAGFASPSGNIRCFVDIYSSDPIDEVDLVCLIFQADWPMPILDDGCDLDKTRMIILPRQGAATATRACHGDVFWPEPLGAISYGSEWSLMGFTCSMATDGVRCENGQGGDFWVRRAALVLD